MSKWVSKSGLLTSGQDYHANIRQFLKGFIIGDDYDYDDMLALLKPDEEGVWEFRIQFEPKARIFGGFLEPCRFVATNYQDRNFLGARGFANDRQRCRTIWETLLKDYPRVVDLTRTRLLEW